MSKKKNRRTLTACPHYGGRFTGREHWETCRRVARLSYDGDGRVTEVEIMPTPLSKAGF